MCVSMVFATGWPNRDSADMYEGFYGLKVDPFRLSADHRFCYPHRSYARAKAYVQYALYRAEGFVLVTGRPGTGKTTLVNDLLATLPNKEVVAGTLVSTQLEAEDLLLMAGHAFGLEFDSPQKALVLQQLIEYFNEQHRKGVRTLLIIDEAQDLAPSALEELRLLTNLQYQGAPLLQIALLGQDALRDIVRTPEMEQVHQRLIASWQLEPLTPEETVGYVRHRLEHAGWTGDPAFEPGVLEIVYRFSKGVPRRINLICSRLLLHGFVGELHTISVEDAETVMRDLHREELALPDYKAEAAAAAPGAAGKGRAARAAPPDDEVWKGIDVGLLGPDLAADAERAAPNAAGRVAEAEATQAAAPPATSPARRAREAEPTRTAAPPIPAARDMDAEPEMAVAAPPSLRASRDPENRAPQRAAPAGVAGSRRVQISDLIVPQAAAPANFRPERERGRDDEPKHYHPRPGWGNAIPTRSWLWTLIGVLAVLWLVLLAVFVIRGAGEAPATADLELPWSEAGETARVPALPREAALVPDDRVAALGPRFEPDVDGPPADRSPPEAVAVVPEPPAPAAAVGPESVAQEVPPLVGKVLFRVNSTNVEPEFEPLLDQLAAALLESERARAEVIGFTDRFGPLELNMSLSRQRARSVANRLIMRGVDSERLLVEGQGPREAAPGEGLTRDEERAVVVTVYR